jgi:hypothetical protein
MTVYCFLVYFNDALERQLHALLMLRYQMSLPVIARELWWTNQE